MAQRAALPRPPPSLERLRVLRAARIIHPFPTLLNVAATAGLALVAWHGRPPASDLARMLCVMFMVQSSIGVANDCFDSELDAATKPWKPIASGLVSLRAGRIIAGGLAIGACMLAVTLGRAGFALAVLGLACGLAYDAGLKRTLLSAIPFMIAIPTLPLWVWAIAGAWDRVVWWLLPLGALIGLALHLANTIPDIESDEAHGVRGLAHQLGRRRSMVACWASFGCALALSAALAPLVHYDARIYVPAATFGAGCLLASALLPLYRGGGFALQAGFGLLGIGSAVLAVAWLAAVT